jgi:D-glucuronyl C5-epimerase C-terminus/Putative peptidoglycan binding domain
VAEPFFTDDDFAWWDEVEAVSPAPAVAVAPRLRPPPRTLAGDLARLRSLVEERSAGPTALLALGLGLAVLLAIVIRPLLADEREAPSVPIPVAAPSQPQSQAAAATEPDAPAAAKPLEEGNRGVRVRDLQVALAAAGVYGGGTDGSFGPATSAAVATFQGTQGLLMDGVAGDDTAAALRETNAERAAEDAEVIRAGLATAVGQGRLEQGQVDDARAAVDATLESVGVLPPGRGAILGLVLHEVAAVADAFGPRASVLFEQLRENERSLGARAPEMHDSSVTDGTGVVYRFYRDHGYQFHPLASFARLNGLAAKGDEEASARLAAALVARGVREGRALVWEYRFPYGGPSVWRSGFAQAAGAQALARAGDLLGDQTLFDAARASFRAIPRDLTLEVGAGDWIQEYGYSDTAILNAQLQSIISLTEYAKLSGNEEAAAFATSLNDTARAHIGSFDTGCWSLYALDGNPASLEYHTYHVTLLERLARQTGDAVWQETAARWRGYLDAGGC